MQDAMLHYMRTNFSTQARSGKAVERDGTQARAAAATRRPGCIRARRAG